MIVTIPIGRQPQNIPAMTMFIQGSEDPLPPDIPYDAHRRDDGKQRDIEDEDDDSYPPDPRRVVREIVEEDRGDTGAHIE